MVYDGETYRCPNDPSELDGGTVVIAGPATDAMLKKCWAGRWRSIVGKKRTEGKRTLKWRKLHAEHLAKHGAA